MRFVALLLKVLDKWWQLTTRLQIRAPHQRFKDKISLLMVSTWLSSSLPCCASLLNGIRHSKLSRVTELAREGSTVMGCRLNHIRIRRNGKCSGSARVSSVTKAGVVRRSGRVGRARARYQCVYTCSCVQMRCATCVPKCVPKSQTYTHFGTLKMLYEPQKSMKCALHPAHNRCASVHILLVTHIGPAGNLPLLLLPPGPASSSRKVTHKLHTFWHTPEASEASAAAAA